MSVFGNVSLAPRDPLFSLNEIFNADPNPSKINLVIGIYTDDAGKIPLMESVQIAAKLKHAELSPHSYLPIEGMPGYREAVQKLLIGKDSHLLENDRIVTVQTLGGTGALKIGADFLKCLFPDASVALSDPSWENHRSLFLQAGFEVVNYAYYDSDTRALNFAGMLASLQSLPARSIVVLHACCHNPTGIDLSPNQWHEVIEICREKKFVPFIDMAYQGFGSDLEKDSSTIRQFIQAGLSFLVSQSFSKNFSLYGERVGALSVVSQDKQQATTILSQLKRLIRANYSNPPTYGATLVSTILQSVELRAMWENELADMRDRIKLMRNTFVSKLNVLTNKDEFAFINSQNGMFSYSGLTAEQVERLKVDHSVYVVPTGRICVARLTQSNLDAVTRAINAVL
jgi:aromatic-amino-acid transaminase